MGGLDVVDPRYGPLLDRARAVLEADERVLRVEVGGSIGSGTADEWSDLDLQVVVDPVRFDAFQADWPAWLAAITPTVFARTPIAPSIINALTDEGLTLDLALFPGEVWAFPPPRYAAGMLGGQQFDDPGGALESAVAEQLRGMSGPFISLLKREEHVRHLTGVAHLLVLLNAVFLAETGNPPLGKHWNDGLTDEQRSVVAALPPVSATAEGLTAFGLALAQTMIERARPLYPRYGLEWPVALAQVAANRLHTQLGVEAPWLTEA
jgi:hypothetical protein